MALASPNLGRNLSGAGLGQISKKWPHSGFAGANIRYNPNLWTVLLTLKLVFGKYLGKVSVWVGRKLARWSGLDNTTVTQDDYHIAVADRAQSMGNDENGAVDELFLYYVVDDTIHFNVD